MKKVQFTKMEGIGNDYIYIDSTKDDIQLSPEQIRFLSNRNFGIGSDGVIFIRNSSKADFQMDMYNSDGSSSEMCGNGIRCVGKFIYDKNLTKKTKPLIETGKGVLELDLKLGEKGKVEIVTVNMGLPILIPSAIPVKWIDEQPIVEQEIIIEGKKYLFTAVSMGNPHVVIFVEDCDLIPMTVIGPLIENNSIFPNRTNVEFVSVLGKNHFYQRTWERGAGETLACGTGACAVAVAGFLTKRSDRQVVIDLRGGALEIHWQESGDVIMKGPAREVFTGEFEID